MQSRLLLLDEVVAGLTPPEIDLIVNLIARVRAGGVSVAVLEHVMHALTSLGDRPVVLHLSTDIRKWTLQFYLSPDIIRAGFWPKVSREPSCTTRTLCENRGPGRTRYRVEKPQHGASERTRDEGRQHFY